MKITTRNIVAYVIAKFKIIRGGPNKIIEKCKNGELILSVYTHQMEKHQLKTIVIWLKKKGISLMSLDELNEVLRSRSDLPKGKAILTMDDGWMNNISVISIAEKMKIPIAIFLTVGPIEEESAFWWSYIKKARSLGLKVKPVEWFKKLSNDERVKKIDELKQLIQMKSEALKLSWIKSKKQSMWVSFGAHTVTHPILINCDENTMSKEILTSRDKIMKWIGKPIRYFAYPNGSYSEREVKFLKENDFGLAFTTKASPIRINQTDPFEIPRCEILEQVSLAENICRITGTWKKVD